MAVKQKSEDVVKVDGLSQVHAYIGKKIFEVYEDVRNKAANGE